MKRKFFLLLFCMISVYSFAQFNDTIYSQSMQLRDNSIGFISDELRQRLFLSFDESPKLYKVTSKTKVERLQDLTYNYLSNRFGADIYEAICAFPEPNNKPTLAVKDKAFMQFLGNYLSKAVEVWIQVDAVMISKGDKSISDVGLRDSIKQAYSERMKFEMQFNEYKGIFECHKVRKAEPRSEGKSVDINEDGMFVHAIPSNLSQETLYDRVMQYLSRRNDVEDIVGSVDKTSVFGKFKMYWSVPSNIFTKGTATSLLLINCYEDKLVISCKDWEVIATEGSGFLSVHGKMKYNSIPEMNSVGKKDNQKDKFIESTTKEINHLVNSLIEQIEK